MDQHEAPLVDALAKLKAKTTIGLGAPGHNEGRGAPRGTKALIGKRAFAADVLTPKGLDDRTEGLLAVQRAHEIAAEAWGADLARFVTGGSTQSLHTVLAAIARSGDTVLIPQNAHKAEFAWTLIAGLNPVVMPVEIGTDWDLEHGLAPATLAAALDANPHAKAAVVVSPTYYGVTSDIPALAGIAHAHGVPLIVDGAWGGAFGFCARLPANPLAQGADVMVASVHKTMGALAQGSVFLARGDLVDRQRLSLAYELLETTSPSTLILGSLDACRRDHALRGEAMWSEVLDIALHARDRLAAIPGVKVLGRADLPAIGAAALDETKILLDIARLGVSGYAIDDWLFEHHQVSVGLSDARHLLAVCSLGTRKSDLDALAHGLADLVARLKRNPSLLPPAPQIVPRLATLARVELTMSAPDAFFAAAELVPLEDAAGRIAAETIAPAPPGVPRLIPGQRITDAHVAWLVAHRDAGAFFLDPADPTEASVRVVAREAESLDMPAAEA
jgi:arginine/lysine/ornithine decarboxylase